MAEQLAGDAGGDGGDSALLGLLSAALLVRDGRPKEHCNKRRLGEKESRLCVAATYQAEDLLAVLPATLSLTLLEVREVDPPGKKDVLHSRLLTTHRLSTPAEAETIIGYYRCRWTIAPGFRVMKTQGFDLEAVPIRKPAPVKNLACATLIAAIQIQRMLHDRDGAASRPITDVFAPEDQPLIETIGQTLEGKTERQKNPHPSGSLAHATWVCAGLGGWTGYGRKPGPIVLVRGHVRLQAMIEGIKRFARVCIR